MLHRALRQMPLVPFALAVVILTAGPGRVPPARAEEPAQRAIRFDEVAAIARHESPRARLIAQQVTAVEAERDEVLQWTNPALAYGREAVGSAREWQVTLHKSLARPFSQQSLRRGWAHRVRAAGHRGEQETDVLVAELEAGYVGLRLLDDHVDRLARLGELVELAAAAAASRHEEGELAGTARRLVQLSSLAVAADRREVARARREAAAAWRAEMGIAPDVEIELVTPISYRPVPLRPAEEWVALLEDRPGLRARSALVAALGEQAEAARPGLLPALDLYGGYKSIDSDGDGWVAGLALALPVFDRSAAAARRLEAQRRIEHDELAILRTHAATEISSLVEAIELAGPQLAAFADQLHGTPPLMETLLFSYREGSLTLDALLNAVQIESQALGSYYRELTAYYANIFRLEAITGDSIAAFGP